MGGKERVEFHYCKNDEEVSLYKFCTEMMECIVKEIRILYNKKVEAKKLMKKSAKSAKSELSDNYLHCF